MKIETKLELDRIGNQITGLDLKKDEAVSLNLQTQVFNLMLKEIHFSEDFSPEQDELMGALLKVMDELKKFDSTKGTLSGFISRRLSFRKIDLHRQDQGAHRKTVKGSDGKKTMEYVYNESLNAYIDDDESHRALEDILGALDPQLSEAGTAQEERLMSEFFSLAASFPERMSGHAKNPNRVNYFRMFFTDGTVSALKAAERPGSFIRHERDMFAAMKLPFLDYFMADECRTIPKIVRTRLKPYSALADGHDGVHEEPKQPLPHDVYLAYLSRVENQKAARSTISEQYKAYQSFVKAELPLGD